jgi:hypothetical protein
MPGGGPNRRLLPRRPGRVIPGLHRGQPNRNMARYGRHNANNRQGGNGAPANAPLRRSGRSANARRRPARYDS